MLLSFAKMHGLGNDYVVVDERERILVPEDLKSTFARRYCRRGFSVGADGVLFVGTAEDADVEMRIFNADGGEAESCGNGLRCVAYFHHGLQRPGQSIFSIAQPLSETVRARVDRDTPDEARVRLTFSRTGRYEDADTLELDGTSLRYHRVDVGNPHAVFFLDENESTLGALDDLDLRTIGSRIQDHPRFEDTGGINAEFVEDRAEDQFRMRVHERGVGETAACGTGGIAVARAGAEIDRCQGWTEVEQPGGRLRVHTEKHHLEGEATLAYTGYVRFDADD